MFKLPFRSSEWISNSLGNWTPSAPQNIKPAEVVHITTALKLERTTTTPFHKDDTISWTEHQRKLAEKACAATGVEEFKTQVSTSSCGESRTDTLFQLSDLHAAGTTRPGQYVELDPDILEGCVSAFVQNPYYTDQDTENLLS